MDRAAREFLDRLAIGPAFLLIGQAFGETASDQDPAIVQAARRAGLTERCTSYRDVAQLESGSRERLFGALGEMATGLEPPQWLDSIARHPWNAVFTSAVDQRVTRAFEADWRRVVPSAGGDRRPRHPRSATELNLHFLYGGVTMPEEQTPPKDDLDLAMRRRDASAALDVLPRGLLTPRGALAIEAYRLWDWLEPAQLFALIGQLLPGQAHLFSARTDLLHDAFISGAVNRGLLTLHPESLSALLDDAAASGRLLRPPSVGGAESRAVRLAGKFVELDRDLWNAVIGTARPVDVSLLEPLGPASPTVRYQQFRAFLGTTEGLPPWSGIASGFNFSRDFEEEMWTTVRNDLLGGRAPTPLVVTGQAASGKSTALLALALRIAREEELAVLHVARRADRPQLAAIDRYALWAEEHEVVGTLLVWDGMTDIDEYFALDRELRARGRRVLIVGSTYLSRQKFSRQIAVPGTLTASEAARLVPWLELFGVGVDPKDLGTVAAEASFLAALYRLLPETRRGLQDGLTLELRTVERDMERFARTNREPTNQGLSVMAAALQRAGVELTHFATVVHETELAEIAFGDRTTAEKLTATVLVAGRRNLRVPLDLVLRTLGREGSLAVIEAVKQFDLIRWSDDESGEQYLGARTALEAELLARSDLRDVRGETPVIAELIANLAPREGVGGPEVQFAVDLLARIGPDSEEGDRFRPHYPVLVEALRDLRATPGGAHPRLMLIEANLTRKWVMWAHKKSAGAPEELMTALRQSEHVLTDALELVPSSGRARLNLLVELAAVLGAQAYELSDLGGNSGGVKRLAERIVESALEARKIDPENYYPVDVVAWVTLDLTKRGSLSPAEQTTLMADSLAALTSVDEEALGPQQLAKYHHRLAQFANIAGNDALALEHLHRLEELEDPAAYFLLGLMESGLLEGQFNQAGATKALDRLVQAPPSVRSDWRCSRLMLDLFWQIRTGERFLRGEREALAFSRQDWEACLDLLDAIGGASSFDRYRVEFLRGLALFHLGQLRQAKSVFEVLDRESSGMSRRIIATYVASTPDGVPVKFTGQVRSVTPDARRGSVWVDQLGIDLPFIPYRFSLEPPERGDALAEFYVAFNMRGPYADPVRTAQPHRRTGR